MVSNRQDTTDATFQEGSFLHAINAATTGQSVPTWDTYREQIIEYVTLSLELIITLQRGALMQQKVLMDAMKILKMVGETKTVDGERRVGPNIEMLLKSFILRHGHGIQETDESAKYARSLMEDILQKCARASTGTSSLGDAPIDMALT